jgi:hypothetical protein
MRDGLLGDVLHHSEADVVVELVHVHGVTGKVAGCAAFEGQDVERSAGDELLGEGEAGPTAADDGDVHRFEVGHVPLLRLIRFGRRVNGLVAGAWWLVAGGFAVGREIFLEEVAQEGVVCVCAVRFFEI